MLCIVTVSDLNAHIQMFKIKYKTQTNEVKTVWWNWWHLKQNIGINLSNTKGRTKIIINAKSNTAQIFRFKRFSRMRIYRANKSHPFESESHVELNQKNIK